MDQDWAPVIDRTEVILEPIRDGILVNAKRPRRLFDRIGSMNFDEARVEPANRHQTAPRSISARTSSTRQAVILGPSLMGFG